MRTRSLSRAFLGSLARATVSMGCILGASLASSTASAQCTTTLDAGYTTGTFTNLSGPISAQTFTPTTSGTVCTVLHGADTRGGMTAYNLYVIKAPGVGAPPVTYKTNNLFVALNQTSFNTLGGGGINGTVQVLNGLSVTAGQRYAIVIEPIGGSLAWRGNNGSPYAGGEGYEWSAGWAPSWVPSVPSDFTFRIFGSAPLSCTDTLDPGYTTGSFTSINSVVSAQTFTPVRGGTVCEIRHGISFPGAGLIGYNFYVVSAPGAGGPPLDYATNYLYRALAQTSYNTLGSGGINGSVPVSQPLTLVGGQRYALVVEPIGGSMGWRGNNGSPYPGGEGYTKSGSTWAPSTPSDFTFRIFGLTRPGLTRVDLAGQSLFQYPFFNYVDSFYEGQSMSSSVDPNIYPIVVGQTAKVWLVDHRDEVGWSIDPTLADVRGTPDTFTFVGGTAQMNTLLLSSGTISGANGDILGKPYDVVLDFDQNGQLSAGDWIDGGGPKPGLWVLSTPAGAGPHPVTETVYSGGAFLGQDLYYPTNIATLGSLPLVVISHGNGHNYQWYDHLGLHLASWGYIVMSHQNDTMPGIEAASTTTLTNTDYLLGNLGTIAGGALQGHLNKHRIVWIGHSRGGEGVARAYDRIFDGTYVPSNFVLSDIVLLSSIAPTNFLGTASANPHDAPYHLWTGGADSDVNGCASMDLLQTFQLHERAGKARQSISLHGVGHGAFHDGGGSLFAAGPCQVLRPDTHAIMRAHILPLFDLYARHNPAGTECLWRQFENFSAPGVPTTACIVVDLMHQRRVPTSFVIDNFQTQPATNTSSSLGTVAFSVTNLAEGVLDDPDTAFTPGVPPMNGMTFASATDNTAGVVFDWNGVNSDLRFGVVAAAQDFKNYEYLSFRAAQSTRDALTVAALGDLDFSVRVRDASNNTSTIRISAFGGGIEEPYQRMGCGAGAGWANEWETVRIRTRDFSRNNAVINLSQIVAVEFLFGPANGSAEGRLGMDEIELVTY